MICDGDVQAMPLARMGVLPAMAARRLPFLRSHQLSQQPFDLIWVENQGSSVQDQPDQGERMLVMKPTLLCFLVPAVLSVPHPIDLDAEPILTAAPGQSVVQDAHAAGGVVPGVKKQQVLSTPVDASQPGDVVPGAPGIKMRLNHTVCARRRRASTRSNRPPRLVFHLACVCVDLL
jgi:hypothetical protein